MVAKKDILKSLQNFVPELTGDLCSLHCDLLALHELIGRHTKRVGHDPKALRRVKVLEDALAYVQQAQDGINRAALTLECAIKVLK